MYSLSTKLCFLLLLLFFGQAFSVVVKLNHGGLIRGNTLKSQEGRTIYAFRGIPFAEPPTGERRFKAPIPKSTWSGQPYDATKDGPPCAQIDLFTSVYMGQEDCLYLNVYTTKPRNNTHNETKMAVMVWIYGGAFTTGDSSSAFYGPGLLLDQDVILVTVNYRLGALGFLSTQNSISHGNYGLMDQTLALKWVKDNIDVFGGDVHQVTIFGESAGGASVGFHVLSPMSKGLFQAAIAQSGTPLSSWALQTDPVKGAQRLAAEFECPTKDISRMVECLREIPAVDIVNKQVTVNPFVPVVGGPFLPRHPEEILASGQINKVPYLSGVNKDEGILVYALIYKDSNSSTIKFTTEALIKSSLDDRNGEATQLIMEKYLSQLDWTDDEEVRRKLVKIFSDASFNMVHYKMMKMLYQNGFRTYTYSLDYPPSVSIMTAFGVNESWGVSHADDLGFLFDGAKWLLANATEEDKKIMKVFCSLWTNFAKYGDPTPNSIQDGDLKWDLSTGNIMNIYHIDNPVTSSIYEVDKDDLYNFWTDVIPSVLNKTRDQRSYGKRNWLLS